MAGELESCAGRIVVGLDGSKSSIAALRWAARTSAALEVPIDVIACWEYPTDIGSDDLPTPLYRHEVDAEQLAAKAIVEVFGDRRPEDLRILVREGQPEKVLTEVGAGAEMLVVGSRGRGGFASAVLGSVSVYCAEHAVCPVVIIHA